MRLSHYADALNLLGDENRLRLCALLGERELCVTDLVRVTGISQSRVSTHLGRLREAGLVRDRRQGTQCFYALASETVPGTVKALLDEASKSANPTLVADQKRLHEFEDERRGGLSESVTDDFERDYSPGRTWKSLAVGLAALLKLGDVLDVGSGDGAAAGSLAPYCRSLTCIDTSERMIEAARERLGKLAHVRARVADVHELPFGPGSFDTVLVFHTLTYAEHPGRALTECARVLRPGGRLVLLCLDRHEQHEVSARYAERHPGFSPGTLRRLVAKAGLDVVACDVASREAKKPYLQVVLTIADKSKNQSPPRKPTTT